MPKTKSSGRVTRTARKPPTETLYVRVPRSIVVRLRARADKLGWPHTLASVAAAAMKRGIDALRF